MESIIPIQEEELGERTFDDTVDLVVAIKNSIYSTNGNFVEYRKVQNEVDPTENTNIENPISKEDDTAISTLNRSLSTYDYLLLQWKEATSQLSHTPSAMNNTTTSTDEEYFSTWFTTLYSSHTEVHRYYHTVVHLEEMCHYLQLICHHTIMNNDPMLCRIKSMLLLSIFFHDAIYDPHSTTNEEDSAKLFDSFASYTNMSHIDRTKIGVYIIATKNHQIPSTDTPDDDVSLRTKSTPTYNWVPLQLFLDLDMMVLGKCHSAYQLYAQCIRQEYSFVEQSYYCQKRVEILELFLAQPTIYHTSFIRTAIEDVARNNLSIEIQNLRNGIIMQC